MSQYGKNFNTPTTAAFVAGINNGVTLKTFQVENVEFTNYTGPVLKVVFEKDGQERNAMRFPIVEEKVLEFNAKYPKKKKEKDSEGVTTERTLTDAEVIEAAYTDFNSWVKHIVCNGVTDEAFDKAVSDATSFEDFCNKAAKLIEGKTLTGKLILGYDKKGYLVVPQKVQTTGPFFSVADKHKLVVSQYINLNPPVKAENPDGEASATDW